MGPRGPIGRAGPPGFLGNNGTSREAGLKGQQGVEGRTGTKGEKVRPLFLANILNNISSLHGLSILFRFKGKNWICFVVGMNQAARYLSYQRRTE